MKRGAETSVEITDGDHPNRHPDGAPDQGPRRAHRSLPTPPRAIVAPVELAAEGYQFYAREAQEFGKASRRSIPDALDGVG